MSQNNLLLRLDLLQCKFQGIRPTRFNKTVKICKSKKKGFKFLQVDNAEAKELIKEYQRELFEQRFAEYQKKIGRVVHKLYKQEKGKSKGKGKDKGKEEDKKGVVEEIGDELIGLYVRAKICKVLAEVFKRRIEEKDTSIPQLYWDELESIKDLHKDNSGADKVFAKLWGRKAAKDAVEKMRTQFRLILGPVREGGDKKRQGRDPEERGETAEASEEEDNYSQYGGMIAGSDEESDEEETKDEEPANQDKDIESDDFFSEPKVEAKKTKIVLPRLASGYISGSDSDSDVDNDKVVQSQTKHRKNRRGQRARRKIWEAKYGREANHVVQEQKEWQAKRERLKEEYERRVEKRAIKAKEREEKAKQREIMRTKPLHPSWIAKRKLEEQQEAKFSGKKIKF